MAEGNNSAAALAASAPIKIETISLPGFGAGQVTENFNAEGWRVKYSKVDTDDPGSLAELEILETKGLMGTEIVVLNKTGWSFMDKYFVLITYLEKITETS